MDGAFDGLNSSSLGGFGLQPGSVQRGILLPSVLPEGSSARGRVRAKTGTYHVTNTMNDAAY